MGRQWPSCILPILHWPKWPASALGQTVFLLSFIFQTVTEKYQYPYTKYKSIAEVQIAFSVVSFAFAVLPQ
ncbi:hypothetical protein CGCS363_v007105 [Colletotrichum siamense]|uniref:uncharacterized protein n=1 Tax=Colletotrichum siamense TaxID=690259 RepID=UPI0018721897|nr:uncharacterized protein CGCS363_v007105 [Colletotrichum siamense]KAF5501239.1 hypothetical protein CGCS363_v007105 [Colletotrichum siamense]